MRPLMVLGCTSDAGKSLVTTALCRWFQRQGVDVAPFKAQNMSNNARVVAGGEIGVAQWLQARAARLEPTVDMNPVLVKPEADTHSQVVVGGEHRGDITALPWAERGPLLWDAMTEAYARLADRHDLVLLEGAGSPAEINLDDRVNRGMLDHVDAAGLLVADIDRGGAFAHLVGTWTLVPESTRSRLAGFVLNKFRGDASLLAPAPDIVAERTGMTCAGVLPMLPHHLPDEEGGTLRASAPATAPVVAVVRWPYGSNIDEWHLLAHAARVRWATAPADLIGVDMIVLPGSKHVAADLAWLRDRGLAEAIVAAASAGVRVLGVCGGAMALGTTITDPHGVEGAAGGLGLLPLRTEMSAAKTVRATMVSFGGLPAPWQALDGRQARGYEIRHGQVSVDGDAATASPLVWARDGVLATTVHGLFEDPDLLGALFGHRPRPVLENTFDSLADAVEEHLDTDLLWRLVSGRGSRPGPRPAGSRPTP